jgi:hypothetical protein
MKQLNIGDSLKFAFTVYQKNFTLILSYGAVLFAINAAYLHFLPTQPTATNPLETLNQISIITIVTLLMLLVSSIIQIFYIRLGLKNFENPRAIPFGEIKAPSFSLVLRFIGVQLVFVLLIVLGFFLFIIPGIILSLCYFFVNQVLVDQDTSTKKVFRISEKLTEGVKWSLLGYSFIIGFFIFLATALNWYYFGFTNPPPIWANLLQVAYSSFIVTPLVAQSSVYLYKDLKMQEEEDDEVIKAQAKLVFTPSRKDNTTTPSMDSIPNS